MRIFISFIVMFAVGFLGLVLDGAPLTFMDYMTLWVLLYIAACVGGMLKRLPVYVNMPANDSPEITGSPE